VVTPLEGLKHFLGESAQIYFNKGDRLEEAIKQSGKSLAIRKTKIGIQGQILQAA
jgi:hypothetical protein